MVKLLQLIVSFAKSRILKILIKFEEKSNASKF